VGEKGRSLTAFATGETARRRRAVYLSTMSICN